MKKILIISYFAGEEGLANSEWVLDKIYAFQLLGYDVELVTSLSGTFTIQKFKVYQLPSVAPSLFISEVKSSKRFDIRILFLIPFVFLFGILIEIIERLLLRRVGRGYWSWTVSVIAFLFTFKLLTKYDKVYTLGGPPSSYLAGLIYAKFTKKRLIIDFQDHLVGPGLGHNQLSAKYLSVVEKILIHSNATIIFHMESVMESAKIRHPNRHNLFHFYTGSREFDISRSEIKKLLEYNKVSFVHFGTIYSSRNFKLINSALNNINSIQDVNRFEITNIGEISSENLEIDSWKVFYKYMPSVPRIVGLKMINDYDVLLLIQHTDERSKASFPFKVWDYLNSGLPILALVNNDELHKLLEDHGHYVANLSEKESIINIVIELVNDITNNKLCLKRNKFPLVDQLVKILESSELSK